VVEQLSFKITFLGQSKLTSCTFNAQVAGSSPVYLPILECNQLKINIFQNLKSNMKAVAQMDRARY
jgi:hypothetical protein